MKVFHLILNEKWVQGLQELLKSATTQTLFQALTQEKQVELVLNLLRARKETTPDLGKVIDEQLIRHPFSLAAIVALLSN